VDLHYRLLYIAFEINGLAPGYLGFVCKKYGMRYIHISTDYVFDGQKEDLYKEDDNVSPLQVYGKTKWFGEEEALKYCAMVLRVQWLYAVQAKSFVDTVINATVSPDIRLQVVNDQFGTPTSVRFLSNMICDIVIQNLIKKGIYHLKPDGNCSRAEFVKYIFERIGNHKYEDKVEEISILNIGKAHRPKSTKMDNSKFTDLISFGTGVPMTDWKKSFDDFLITNYGEGLRQCGITI
jgi:dTDP-4-dehydrorhamnose reductase